MNAPFRRILGDENDKFLFGLAFFGGISAILMIRIISDFLFKNDGVSFFDVIAILVAVCVIVAYVGAILISKDRSAISIDRASDNVYYLGLLFTLASLAYSLIKLSFFNAEEESASASQVLSLLPDFGLALFSTIAGIFGRIFLQQMRNDPLDVETAAREELGIAIRQLRETIGQVVNNLNGLSATTSITLEELNTKVSSTLQMSAEENKNLVQGVANEVADLSSKLRNQVDEVTEFTAATTTQFNDILTSMRSQFENFLAVPQDLGDNFGNLADKIGAASAQIDEASEKQTQLANEMLNAVSALREAFSDAGLSRISGIVEDAENKFSEINYRLKESEERLNVSLDGINERADSLKNASNTVGGYGQKIVVAAKSVDEASNEYVEELSKAAETLRVKTDQS